ncbi:MAG: BamA/TamA family outer membrane protein [Rhodobacter sp.]|nr:BamA/TamA family outer membrane protein [Rhodobacter sp.]
MAGIAALMAGLAHGPDAEALDRVRMSVAGGDSALRNALGAASLVVGAYGEKVADPHEIFGAALADYRTLVETLYANGYYSGVVQIRIDGREAADIALLEVPRRIGEVVIRVDPGPPFRFGAVEIGPAPRGAAGLDPPRPGARARSTDIRDAVEDTVDAWRDAGHATAAPAGQSVVADHAAKVLSARVQIDPGPQVRFGDLVLTGPSAVRAKRIERIAGFPSGAVFSPDALRTVATRLRRTGAFSSVALSEPETLGSGDTMDIALSVVDEKPRRFGFGAEIASFEGLRVSGFWLHRNFFGGAERFRFEAEVENIGGQTGGIDYSAGVRLESPAAFGADTKGFALAEFEHLEEPDFRSDRMSFGFGAGRIFSDTLQAEAGVTFTYSETDDDLGAREFTLVSFPVSATWDRRDEALDPTSGTFLAAEVTPFWGVDGTASGVRAVLDGRAYRGFGTNDGVVVAGRLQVGSVSGAALTEVHPDFLFYSGGGGTVRGQPYQSLNVDLGGGVETGGRSFVGLSGELRTGITDRIGAVAFVDAGYIGTESFFDGSGEWHAGAGLGVRYKTTLGPIRFDVAAPVGGDTGDGVQLYLGIGQAF